LLGNTLSLYKTPFELIPNLKIASLDLYFKIINQATDLESNYEIISNWGVKIGFRINSLENCLRGECIVVRNYFTIDFITLRTFIDPKVRYLTVLISSFKKLH
jgi:hypothetical protein